MYYNIDHMNIHKKFHKIFKLLDCNDEILILLQETYDNKIFNKEIILNIVKGMVVLIYNNININKYINILKNIIENKNNIIYFIKTIDKLNLSYQFKIEDDLLCKVIVYTDQYLSQDINIVTLLFLLNKVIIIIKNLNISNNITLINLYINLLKNIINSKTKEDNIIILNEIKIYINMFLK